MQAEIKGKAIVIRLPISSLKRVVDGAWAAGAMGTRMKLTDPAKFAEELVHTLNEEEEDGTTRLHRCFDDAIEHAIEWGAEGIEEHPKQEA